MKLCMKYYVLSILSLFVLSYFTHAAYAQWQSQSAQVNIDENGFNPKTLEINVGTTVIFKNTDQKDHWPASNIHPTHQIYSEFDPKKPINPGKSWQFKFEKEGQWKYHDHLYPQLVGIVVVSENSQIDKPTSDNLFTRIIKVIKALFRIPTKTTYQRHYDASISKDNTTIFSSDDALYSYIKKFGPKKTTAHLNELTAQFGDCHQTAHKAGRFAYEIYSDSAFEQCGAQCHSGCYHGATEAYFKDHGTANLTENLNVLCKSQLNPFFSHQCVHGIGHGLMAWSNYELDEALKSCDLLSQKQDSCWTGVFMENIIGALSEKDAKKKGQTDHVSKYLSDDPLYPCDEVSEKYKSSCYFLQTSRMMQLYNGDFKKIASACLEAPDIYQRVCFESMGRDVGGVTRGKPEQAILDCSNAPEGDLRIGCLIGTVQDSFWDPSGQDEAIKFCNLLTDSQEKRTCYDTIFERAPQVLTSKDDMRKFCSKIEPVYQQRCNSFKN